MHAYMHNAIDVLLRSTEPSTRGMLACYWEEKLLWSLSSPVFSSQRYTKQRRKQSSFLCHNILCN